MVFFSDIHLEYDEMSHFFGVYKNALAIDRKKANEMGTYFFVLTTIICNYQVLNMIHIKNMPQTNST